MICHADGRDIFTIKRRLSRPRRTGPTPTSIQPRELSLSVADGGSQFHWPPLVSGSLQPIMAHGPRFWPRPATNPIATGPRRTKGFHPSIQRAATAKGFATRRRRKEGVHGGRESAGCLICMQFTRQPTLLGPRLSSLPQGSPTRHCPRRPQRCQPTLPICRRAPGCCCCSSCHRFAPR